MTPVDEEPASGFRADSLALGMAIMLSLTIVQRGVGFLRGIWFCRLLDETDLGRWAMAFNFVNDLNASLRQVRVVSLMRFMQGIGFTVGGIGWLASGGGFAGLIVTFAVTTSVATAPGLVSLRRGWGGLPRASAPLDTRAMWRRLIPYAAALWIMNLLGNGFELSDRHHRDQRNPDRPPHRVEVPPDDQAGRRRQHEPADRLLEPVDVPVEPGTKVAGQHPQEPTIGFGRFVCAG